jgi:hypothetical protein
MNATCIRHAAFGLALLSATPALPQSAAAQPLPAGLPLRRDAAVAEGGHPWLAAGAALALLALGGTVLVGRQRRWTWLQPGISRRDPGRDLVRLSSQVLTAQASLHAVRWNGEELLLGCTAQHVTVLARRPAAGADAGSR